MGWTAEEANALLNDPQYQAPEGCSTLSADYRSRHRQTALGS